jgi:nicotinamidase-related amidase
MPHTALFIIDIQNDLALHSQTAVPAAGRIRNAGAAILETARARIKALKKQGKDSDLIIVFVQHEEKPEDGVMVRGSTPWELVFKPRDGEAEERVVSKNVREWSSRSMLCQSN